MSKRWSEGCVPAQDGRVAVITGGNAGLGFETARVLAAAGASVVLAVRDVEKGKRAAARIAETAMADVTVQELDLASLASVREAAAELDANHRKVDLLINNAGVMYTPRQTTRDGFELQFGTNHLGHFAFTGLLLHRLLPVPGSRVVTVTSLGHRLRATIDFDDLHGERSYHPLFAYAQSKLANLMFVYELQRRLTARGATSVAVAAHPGYAGTELLHDAPAMVRMTAGAFLPWAGQKVGMGALPTIRAATDLGVLGGQCYGPDWPGQSRGHPRAVTSSPQSYDLATQQRLWAVSEELTGVRFPV